MLFWLNTVTKIYLGAFCLRNGSTLFNKNENLNLGESNIIALQKEITNAAIPGIKQNFATIENWNIFWSEP